MKTRLKIGDLVTLKKIKDKNFNPGSYCYTTENSINKVIKIDDVEIENYSTNRYNIQIKTIYHSTQEYDNKTVFNVNSYCFRKISRKEHVAFMI